jgi:hypothetical protein
MKKRVNEKLIIRLALIFGVIYLASNNQDGWGWLLFILFLTL